MTYGYQVHGHDDKLLVAAKKRNKYGTEKILPGTLLVNQIPLCLYFPPFFGTAAARLTWHIPFSTPHSRVVTVVHLQATDTYRQRARKSGRTSSDAIR
jgi:hypothetical protein